MKVDIKFDSLRFALHRKKILNSSLFDVEDAITVAICIAKSIDSIIQVQNVKRHETFALLSPFTIFVKGLADII